MERKSLSRRVDVRDRRAAAAFADPLRRRVVLLLAARERSASELAVECGVDLRRLHYHVTALVALGVVVVSRLVPRAGRPIRIYAATADAFFVPLAAMRSDPGAALATELQQSLANLRRRSRAGVLFDVDDDGEPRMRTVGDGGTRVRMAERWWSLALTEADRARLIDAIEACVRPYVGRRGPPGDRCLVHFAFAPRIRSGRRSPDR